MSKRLTDPSFRYTPAIKTDLRKTFARLRRQARADAQAEAEVEAEAAKKVAAIGRRG